MANTWTSVRGIPAHFEPDTMILLTDGSVLVHHAFKKDWYRLTPDKRGRYASGTWSRALKMRHMRQFFASGVLRDSRVFAIGGEYSDPGNETPLGEIFDPATNTWSPVAKPSSFDWIASDAPCCVLPDGRVLLGSTTSNRTAIWNPASDVWTEAGLAFGASPTPTKEGNTAEETWVLLQDGTVVTVRIDIANGAERYDPATDRWSSAGTPAGGLALLSLNDPVTNTDVDIREIGPGLTLPDGRALFVGGTGRTGYYRPPTTPGGTGTWSAGPNLPADTSENAYNSVNGNLQTVLDGPAVLLPSGKVLLVAGNTVREVNDEDGSVGFWSNPCIVYVLDPTANTVTALATQPSNNDVDVSRARLLGLPTGQVLFTSQQEGQLQILTPDPALTAPNVAWAPTVTSVPTTLVIGHSFVVRGTQLCGLSQASSYGDDAAVATNYPLVRLHRVGSSEVRYLPTSKFSTLTITPGAAGEATFTVPSDVPSGAWDLVVVSNGIPSASTRVQVVDAHHGG